VRFWIVGVETSQCHIEHLHIIYILYSESSANAKACSYLFLPSAVHNGETAFPIVLAEGWIVERFESHTQDVSQALREVQEVINMVTQHSSCSL
jgi:hypothetical protein